MSSREHEREVGKMIDEVFESLGTTKFPSWSRNACVDHLICHPFFIDRHGGTPRNTGDGREIITAVMPRFDMGYIVGTPKFKLSLMPDEAVVALTRHAIGDWGDVCMQDKDMNDEAMDKGGRIISKYKSRKGKSFYIVTEDDRSVTTCLMVEEY